MKTNVLILVSLVTIMLLSAACGGGITSNEHLGDLPGIAKLYTDKMVEKKKELKACTDRDKYFTLNKELELLKDEANKTFTEYMAGNPVLKAPFEQKADYKFKVKELSVENASRSRLHLKAKVTVTEDIKDKWGNFERNFFAFVQAVDKEGKQLTYQNGVMMNSGKSPFKAGMEVEMTGSIDGLEGLVNFEKMIFVEKQ